MGLSRRHLVLIVAALVACSRYDDVKNLASSGTAIVAFGDSLTAGYGAGDGRDYPTVLSGITGAAIINAGANGDTTESALQRLESDVLPEEPRIVIVGLGGNDVLRGVPITQTEANLRSIITQIQDAGAMVILLGFRFPMRSGYEAMYGRVAEETGSLLIDDLLDGILSDPNLKSDAIHPNAAGYRLMAERIAGPLQKLITAAEKATRP